MILQRAGWTTRCDDSSRPLPRWNWMLPNCTSPRLPSLQSVRRSLSDVPCYWFTSTNNCLLPVVSTEARSKETVVAGGRTLEMRGVHVTRTPALLCVPVAVTLAQGCKFSCVGWELCCCWRNCLVWLTRGCIFQRNLGSGMSCKCWIVSSVVLTDTWSLASVSGQFIVLEHWALVHCSV